MKSYKTFFLITALVLFFVNKDIAQVNLQTGAAQFNLPLFSFSDQNNLSTSISLNYFNGNGLKVSEMASSVGTGWNLQLGGTITREQRGLPDDQRRSPSYPNPLPTMIISPESFLDTYYPNGYLYSAYSSSDQIRNEVGWVRMYPSNFYISNGFAFTPSDEYALADREQDVFTLEIAGSMTEFVIGRDKSVKVLNDTRVSITPVFEDLLNQNIKTTISKFIVTGTDGNQYYFENRELAQLCSYDKVGVSNSGGYVSLDDTQVFDPHIGLAYPLGSVSPNSLMPAFIGKRTQKFIVNKWCLSQIVNPRTSKKILFTYENFDMDMPTTRQISVIDNGNDGVSIGTTIYREVLKGLRIKKIECPASRKVEFVYNPGERTDIPGLNALKEVQISENNFLINKYEFVHGYFFRTEIKPFDFSFDEGDKYETRLCLNSIQKFGNDETSEPPYSFSYYTENGTGHYKDRVPPMNSYLTDHWGYYNSMNTHRAEIMSSNDMAPNYIHSPDRLLPETGWGVIFPYPTNKIPVEGMAKVGILKEIINPLGGSVSFEYEQNSAFFNGQNVFSGGVRVNQVIKYDGIDHNKDNIQQYKYVKENGVSSSGFGYEEPSYSVVKYNRVYQQSAGKYGLPHVLKDFAQSILKGSSLGDAATAALLSFIAHFFNSAPEFTERQFIEYSNISNQCINPLPALYSRVEEALLGSNGKTVYEFTSDEDTPIESPTLVFPFSNKSRCIKWAYGLPKRIRVYDNNRVIKETINTYFILANFYQSMNFKSQKNQVFKYTIDEYNSSHGDYLAQTGNISTQEYYQRFGHAELREKKERIYDIDENFSETITIYEYNLKNHQIHNMRTTSSKGKAEAQLFYYPEDYNIDNPGNSALLNLVKNNMVNTIISTETWQRAPAMVAELISANAIEFGLIGNEDIKPIKTHSLQTNRPVSENLIGHFNPEKLVRDIVYIVPKTENIYDNNSNLIQINNLISKHKKSIMYGYDDKYPVATISNASSQEVAYTSFEDGLNYGKWILDDVPVETLEGLSPTGRKYLNLEFQTYSPTITTLLSPTNKDYTLSFWTTSDNFSVNGSQVVAGPTINGWTYYEYSFPIGSNSPIISGQTNIDELRFYPQNATLSTVTYIPGVGKTSECDINNRISYYEYDGLGRISMVKDEKRNVIKTYEYHYKN